MRLTALGEGGNRTNKVRKNRSQKDQTPFGLRSQDESEALFKNEAHFAETQPFAGLSSRAAQTSDLLSPFHALSASWWPFSLEFEHRNFPRHWSRRHSTFVIRKAGSNTSRKVLEKHVDVAENRRPQKAKSYASDTNNCFDDQSFSRIGVLFSTQR